MAARLPLRRTELESVALGRVTQMAAIAEQAPRPLSHSVPQSPIDGSLHHRGIKKVRGIVNKVGDRQSKPIGHQGQDFEGDAAATHLNRTEEAPGEVLTAQLGQAQAPLLSSKANTLPDILSGGQTIRWL